MKTANRKQGFSLIEVNLAILLIAVGLLALFSLFPLGLKESERGLADTQEAMFADTVLSGMEGNAMSMTNWADWADMDEFKAKLKDGIPAQYAQEKGANDDPAKIEFPEGTRYKIRYKLELGNSNGSGSRKYAQLHVLHGTHGNFGLASVYYTEFVYTGM